MLMCSEFDFVTSSRVLICECVVTCNCDTYGVCECMACVDFGMSTCNGGMCAVYIFLLGQSVCSLRVNTCC